MNDNRKLILKVLLFCLAFTAIAGILAVMSSSHSLGRVIGTGFWATFCALLMLAFASRSDKKLTQQAVTLGMIIVIIEFALVLGLIWEVPEMLGLGHRASESLGVTCLIMVPWGTAGMIFLSLYASPFTRAAGITGLCAIGISFVIALIASWSGDAYFHDERWWGIAWSLAMSGIFAALSLVGVGTPVLAWTGSKPEPEQGSLRHWRWLGVFAAAGSAIVFVFLIWSDQFHASDDGFFFIVPIMSAIALLVPFLNLVLLAPLLPSQRWLGQLTASLGVATIAMLTAMGIMQEENDMMLRFIAAGGIATACACLALLVLVRLNIKTTFGEAQTVDILIDLTCPRCRRTQHLAPGPSQCSDCGLKIELKIEDPRCTQCGYLLYRLEADNCPECGNAIVTIPAIKNELMPG